MLMLIGAAIALLLELVSLALLVTGLYLLHPGLALILLAVLGRGVAMDLKTAEREGNDA